jgi:hypothetical protein
MALSVALRSPRLRKDCERPRGLRVLRALLENLPDQHFRLSLGTFASE